MTTRRSAYPGASQSRPASLEFVLGTVAALTLAGLCTGCNRSAPSPPDVSYKPRARAITVTTVPLLVKESEAVYPFLKSEFAKGGILEGKEVYAFVPSTITAVQGDTIQFTLVNPEDDVHTFVLPGLTVALPGKQITHATYFAQTAGVFPLLCDLPNHLPMMSGQVVVLAPSALEGVGSATR